MPRRRCRPRRRVSTQNVANFVALMTENGRVVPDFDDEVVTGACLTHAGEVRHPPTAEALASALESGSLSRPHATTEGTR